MVFSPVILLLGASVLSVKGQITSALAPRASPPSIGTAPLPLTEYKFQYPNLPEQVNPFPIGRGPQTGYNVCNSTTEGPESMCQTMFVNSIDDFCLWGSPTANGLIGDVEAQVVAYCTKPGHGTRLIPAGSLTAVQFIKTPGYIQVTGLFDQTGIGLQSGDTGGELDPHGADLAGNPLGGLVFSSGLPTSGNAIVQVNNWNNFVGGNQFCIKACDNSITNPDYCQNIYDTEGCDFNMPAAYAPGEFTSCLGDNQAPAGDPSTYTPVIPATSSCTTYTSSLLYTNSAAPSATAVASSPAVTGTASANGVLPTNAVTTGSTHTSGVPSATASTSSAAAFAMGGSMNGFFAVVAGTIAGLCIVW